MMAIITTTCPHCGTVELGPEDVAVVLSPREGIAWYVFDCAGCVRRIAKPACDAVVAALGHAQVATWTVPAEVLEREDAAPLRVDEVLDAVLALHEADDVVALAQGAAA